MMSAGANPPTEGGRPGVGTPRVLALVSIAPSCSDQVALVSGGGQLLAEVREIKNRLVTLATPVFLPKNCALQFEVQRPERPAARLEGIVRKVQMLRTTLSYHVSVRLTKDPESSLEELAAGLDGASDDGPTDFEPFGPDTGPIPRWTRHLIRDGALTKARLDQMEEERVEKGLTLEAALVEAGFVPDESISRCVALDSCLCYVELDDFDLQLANAALVPEDLARRHRVFPLFTIDGVITLAMKDPTDLALIDQIRLRANSHVDACMCSSEGLDSLIERGYRSKRPGQASGPQPARPATRNSVEAVPTTNTIVALVQALVEDAARDGASDVHIEPERHGARVRCRIDGILHERSVHTLEQHAPIVSRIKVLANLDITETRRSQDGQFSLPLHQGNVDVRVSTLPTIWGEAVVLRLLLTDGDPVQLHQIGMPSDVLLRLEQFLVQPNGMILVTGPTGSGKTTTLYAALAQLSTVERNIVTIEDPVERRIPLLRQVQVNTAAGVTFASGLRSVLRQDPDVIMVGEIRDRETAEIATQAALTGHLVLSTLHTNSAAEAIVRLCEIGIPPFLITASLRAVISQRLARRICNACRRETSPDPKLFLGLGLAPADSATFMKGAGCSRCLHTGYTGRVGIYEMLSISADLSAALLGGANRDEIASEANRATSGGLLEDGLRQVRAGVTTLEEVARVVGTSVAAAGARQGA